MPVWIVHENVATLYNKEGDEVNLLNVQLIKGCSPVPNLKSELGLLRMSEVKSQVTVSRLYSKSPARVWWRTLGGTKFDGGDHRVILYAGKTLLMTAIEGSVHYD